MTPEQLREIYDTLNEAEDALALSYQVCDWPANGSSMQDHALKRVRLTLNMMLNLPNFSLDEKTRT